MDRIGVVDTMFARYDMGAEAVDELEACPGFDTTFEVVRRTVPGFKDLGVACKRLMQAQLMTSTHILEVFVHENEEEDPEKLAVVCINRARKHAVNAYWMLYEPEQLTRNAGRGIRQGYEDAGPLVS